jgi:hypothetical protein
VDATQTRGKEKTEKNIGVVDGIALQLNWYSVSLALPNLLGVCALLACAQVACGRGLERER